jgi:hypothetical protein
MMRHALRAEGHEIARRMHGMQKSECKMQNTRLSPAIIFCILRFAFCLFHFPD